jgi:hypothetical protein
VYEMKRERGQASYHVEGFVRDEQAPHASPRDKATVRHHVKRHAGPIRFCKQIGGPGNDAGDVRRRDSMQIVQGDAIDVPGVDGQCEGAKQDPWPGGGEVGRRRGFVPCCWFFAVRRFRRGQAGGCGFGGGGRGTMSVGHGGGRTVLESRSRWMFGAKNG